MNHRDTGGYFVAVPFPWRFALCLTSTVFPVFRTTPEDTSILEFLVIGKMNKRATIVARKIGERDERS